MRPTVRPTMRDVAELAGVSLKTVSRVLNAEPAVADGTAERVRVAVERLGFRRNDIAAGLRRGSRLTASIGLVIEDVANPFSSTLTRAVEDVARAHRVLLLAGSSAGEPDRERELVEVFCARRVDGLIVVPAGRDQSYLAGEVARGTAVVFADRPPSGLTADAVTAANAAGARAAVDHLIAHGHRDIGYVGDDVAIWTAAERMRGYQEAIRSHRLRLDPALVRTGVQDADQAALAVRDLLAAKRPPTAIFTGNNLLTVGAYRALRGTARPVALVGFDDFDLADLLEPAVTVVAHDTALLGRTAAELLFARLTDPTRQPTTVTLPATLVARGSGEVRA